MRSCGAIIALVLLAIAFANAAGAQERVDPRNHGVIWTERPDASAFERFYPEAARYQDVTGRVVLMCIVRSDTHTDCTIESEEPTGWGFGSAALSISGSFRLLPMVRDGQTLETGRVRVPVAFRLADEDRPDPSQLSPELREFMENWPEPDLPSWDMAPTASEVAAEYPRAALAAHVRGRAILSCTIRDDRTLTCHPVAETPDAHGFSEAALRLSQRFRVSAYSADFLASHRSAPFLLPINFGAPVLQEPLSTQYSGVGPITVPAAPAEIIRRIYPSQALSNGIGGDVMLLCSLRDALPPVCEIESQSHAEWRFGEAALDLMGNAPFTADALGLLPGDQLRIPFHFRPN